METAQSQNFVETSNFYSELIAESNVVDSTHIDSNLRQNHTNFDNSEFNKDIREMDIISIVDTLTVENITAKFELPEAKGGAKSKSTSIQSFRLSRGDVFGIGNNTYSNCLLLKGMKSFFTQHPYKFGDDE